METMQEDGAELVGMTEGRGGDCGRGGASRRRQERSVRWGNGEGESQGRGGEPEGEAEGNQGSAWRREGDPGRRGSTQAGWRWPACGCARRARALQSFWRELEEDKGERWGGPTVLGQHSAGQVSGR